MFHLSSWRSLLDEEKCLQKNKQIQLPAIQHLELLMGVTLAVWVAPKDQVAVRIATFLWSRSGQHQACSSSDHWSVHSCLPDFSHKLVTCRPSADRVIQNVPNFGHSSFLVRWAGSGNTGLIPKLVVSISWYEWDTSNVIFWGNSDRQSFLTLTGWGFYSKRLSVLLC